MRSRQVAKGLAIAFGLMVLLALNFYLRHTLEQADQRLYSFLEWWYADATTVVFSPDFPKWRLLLPIPEISGTWTTTTLILAHLVEVRIGPANTWYLFNAILIAVSVVTSWVVLRSWVFGFTLAICMGFGTQLYHTYGAPGSIGLTLLFVYYQLLMVCAFKVVSGERPWLWRFLFVPALFLTVLSYEGWLDFLVFVWLGGAYLGVVLWRLGDRARCRRLIAIVGIMTVCGAGYVFIKTTAGYAQGPGSESDVVFNYPARVIAVEDVISNVLTHGYIVFTNFLPPVLVGSNSLYELGPRQIVDLQANYSPQFSYLVVMSHVFFWRYYAGAAMVIYLLILWKAVRRSLIAPTAGRVTLAVFLIMAGIGGPTHDFIKFRAMNSMPLLGYHVLVGVLGISLVISFALMTASQQIRNRVGVAALILAAWGTLFYSALSRPAFLNHQAAQVGLGAPLYPDPMATLKSHLGLTSTPAPGAEVYQLTKFEPPVAAPAPPAVKAPDLSEWTASEGVIVTPTVRGHVVTGNGRGGYQLLSPPIAVSRQQRLAVRVALADGRRRVCIGVLDRLQESWLAFADATQPEITFDTAEAEEIRLALVDCRPAADRQPLRFTVDAVTYSVLNKP